MLISDPYLNDGYHRGGAELMERVCSASTESIVRSSGLSPKETRSALGILELEGKVERTATGWRRRR